jgi:DNA repair protein RadC
MTLPAAEALAAVPDEIRALAGARPEGSLWLVFFDRRGARALLSEVAEGTQHVDELFVRHVVDTVLRMGLPSVMLAVWREDGRPRKVDRRLGREVRQRLSGTVATLVDVVVIGPELVMSIGPTR